MKNNEDLRIVFLGRSFGEIVRDKLKGAGYKLVGPESTELDLVVVGFYGKILPKEMLEKPKYGALNVHPSLLPKYRGPSPVQTTILNGDTKTGVTIIQMDKEVDHGPILAAREFQISNFQFQNEQGKPATPELEKVLWTLGADLLLEVIPKWVAGEITPKEQNHKNAIYSRKLSREDGHIDWNQSAEYIERQVRAFTPWPGAFTFWKGERVKILKAHLAQGKLVVDELQLEGKKPTTLREFLLGHKDFSGTFNG
ncbi:MAG: methionyl-tRNA formyltransferase [Patescibacteria group bacterium]